MKLSRLNNLVIKRVIAMNSQYMTTEQIRQTGIELLTKHLGVTGMVRFFQQNELECGDYRPKNTNNG